jgi:hypothetical protein
MIMANPCSKVDQKLEIQFVQISQNSFTNLLNEQKFSKMQGLQGLG